MPQPVSDNHCSYPIHSTTKKRGFCFFFFFFILTFPSPLSFSKLLGSLLLFILHILFHPFYPPFWISSKTAGEISPCSERLFPFPLFLYYTKLLFPKIANSQIILLCSKYFTKYFPYIDLLNTHNNSQQTVLLFSLFIVEVTKVENVINI